jgi:hypothetical protein
MIISIRSWGMWLILEFIVTGGYHFAEQNLQPLLPELIPAPYQNLGWTALHAVLQLAIWYRLWTPLAIERLLDLYPALGTDARRIAYRVLPCGLLPMMAFLFWPRRHQANDSDSLPGWLAWRRGYALLFLLNLSQLPLLLGFIHLIHSDAPEPEILGRTETYKQMTYYSASPITAQLLVYFSGRLNTIELLKAKMETHPESFNKAPERIAAYRDQGVKTPFDLTLLMGVELRAILIMTSALSQEQKTKTGSGRLTGEQTAEYTVDLLDSHLGILELYREQREAPFRINPISTLGLGGVELLAVMSLDVTFQKDHFDSARKHSQDGLLKLEKIKGEASLDPVLLTRIQDLNKRVETMFPDIWTQ